MKKKKFDRVPDELKPLGSELGSFDLEPPRIYRDSQRDRVTRTGEKRTTERTRSQKPYGKYPPKRKPPKKRKNKKKLYLILAIIGFIVGVAIILGILSVTVLFKIDTINVSGNDKYTTKQILAVLQIEKDKNLLMCDIEGAREKLEKNLPYIYEAHIERKIPSSINVKITEADTIYAVKNNDKTYTLMDDKFKVLESSVAKLPKKAILVQKITLASNVAGEEAVLSNMKRRKDLMLMADAIRKQNLKEITAIYSTGINSNYLVYNNKITIKIGSTSELQSKLYSAYAAIEKIKDSNPDASGELTSMGGKQVYFTEAK